MTHLILDKGDLLDDVLHDKLELECQVLGREDSMVILIDVGC